MSNIKCEKCGKTAYIIDIEKGAMCIKCANEMRLIAGEEIMTDIVKKEDVTSSEIDDFVRIPVDSFWDETHGAYDINELYKVSGGIASRIRTAEDEEEFIYPCGRYKKDGHGCFCPLCSAIQNLMDVVYKQEHPKAYWSSFGE